MDKYEQYFNEAKDKFRHTGVGGMQEPNPDLTANPVDPIKVDPKRQVILKNDWVMVGGKTIKPHQQSSSTRILPGSDKIIDAERRANHAPKENKQGDNSDRK